MTDILVYTEEQGNVIAGSVQPDRMTVAVLGAVGGGTGGSGAVSSVNGQIGHVVLDAADVGADAAGTAAAAVSAHEADTTPHAVITQVDKFGFDTAAAQTAGVGEMVWNAADGTADLGLPGGVTLQVGQEGLIRVLNKTGSTIQNMHVVYITGAHGNRVTAAQAQANNVSADKTLAVATQDIANNAEGFATILGMVRQVNTSAWAEGTELWLSAAVAGAITNVRPASPNHQVRVGYVVRSHATEGVIYVTVNIGADLSHLHDVVITAPNDNDVLAYDAATQTWRNESQTGGSGEVNTASNLGAGAGVFASKVAADLQFKSLVAGANVSITSNATTVTVSATGGGGGGAVDSVNGQTGAVVLDTDDISEGVTNLYFTNARASAAAPVQSVNGQTGAVDLSGSYAPLSHVGTGGTAHANVVAGGAAGFMTGADKTKLDGIAPGAQVNVGTDISIGYNPAYVFVNSSTGTDATLDAATTLAAGVMSAADKSKLDGIAAGAMANPMTSAGDLIVGASGGAPSRLGMGSALQVLRVNSAGTGLEYAAPSGGGGGLTNLTEAKTVAAPNDTTPVVSLSVTITETNGDYAILPKGTGAIVAAIPDNAATGGNKRGTRAVDLQLLRSSAAQVASGANAVIAGGENNTASAAHSVVAGGRGNIASAMRSFVGGGNSNTASGGNDVVAGGNSNTSSGGQNAIGGGSTNAAAGQHNTIAGGQNGNTGTGSWCTIAGGLGNTTMGAGDYRSHLGGLSNAATAAYASTTGGRLNTADGQYSVTLGGYQASAKGITGAVVHASGRFAANGDAQAGRYTLRIATSNATPAVLTADAAGTPVAANSLTLGGFNAYSIKARVIVRNTSTNECAAWEVSAIAKRGNFPADTSIVGTPTITSLGGDAALSAASIAVSANTTLGSVAFTVTGIASTNLRWVALVETVEVG